MGSGITSLGHVIVAARGSMVFVAESGTIAQIRSFICCCYRQWYRFWKRQLIQAALFLFVADVMGCFA